MSLLSVPRVAWRLFVAMFAVVSAVLLVAVAPAGAAAPLSAFYAGPIAQGSTCNSAGDGVVPSTQADAYTDFCIAYSSLTDPETDVNEPDLKREVIDTPRGFAASAGNYPTCTDAQFAYDDKTNDACPAAAQVGAVVAQITTQITARSGASVPLAVPDVPGKVYNLPHGLNEVARLGITLNPFVIVQQPLVKVIVSVTLRPAPDVGLRSIIDNLPTRVGVNPPTGGATQDQPLNIDEFALTFWGPAGHTPQQTQPFAFLGSSCTSDQTTTFAGTTYDGVAENATAKPYRLTGCDAAIPFTPSLSVTTDQNRPDVTTSTTIHVGFAESTTPGFVASTVKSTTVVLPPGLALSGQIASGADGLPLCTAAQFAQTSSAANACAPSTAIGTVTITSPAVQPALIGNAYLGAQPSERALPDLYIEASLSTAADAPRVKLIAHLSIDDQNRIVTTLDDLPELPVTDLGLTFRGGDHSALVTPPQCGTGQASLSAAPWTAPTAPVAATAAYSVTDDCDAVEGFSPAVAFKVDDPASAGKSSPLTTTIARPDRSPRLAHVEVDLPPGELAFIKGVPECSPSDASAGTCPAATRVGSLTAAAGVGPAPYSAPGDVYLTSRANGDVAGLSLHVPIRFGDVDLGQLNVPARVLIRSNDLGLRVVADVPQRYAGIPLNLQRLAIDLDRPGFALSPTNCGPLSTVSHLTDDTGNVAAVPSAPFRVSGCDQLPFAPQLDAAVTGATTNKGRPTVAVAINVPAGSLALRQTFVLLPKGLSVDLNQIPRACAIDQFNASSCPATSTIGQASGTLAIADEPLAGDVVLLKVPGQVLPGIGLAFKGRFAGNVQGVTATDPKTSQLRTNFAAIPDLPITSLNITIAGGTNGILIATEALCQSASVKFGATFVSQAAKNGAQTLATYCGAPLGASAPTISGRLAGVKKGKPTLALSVKPAIAGGTQLKVKQFDIAMPTGFALSTSRAKSSKGVGFKSVTPAGKATARRVGKNTLHVVLPAAGATFAKVLTRTNTITIASSKTRKSTKPVVFQVSVLYTNGKKVTVPVSLAPH